MKKALFIAVLLGITWAFTGNFHEFIMTLLRIIY